MGSQCPIPHSISLPSQPLIFSHLMSNAPISAPVDHTSPTGSAGSTPQNTPVAKSIFTSAFHSSGPATLTDHLHHALGSRIPKQNSSNQKNISPGSSFGPTPQNTPVSPSILNQMNNNAVSSLSEHLSNTNHETNGQTQPNYIQFSFGNQATHRSSLSSTPQAPSLFVNSEIANDGVLAPSQPQTLAAEGSTPLNTPVSSFIMSKSANSKELVMLNLKNNLSNLASSEKSVQNNDNKSESDILDNPDVPDVFSKAIYDAFLGASSGLIESYPQPVQNRIKALETVHHEYMDVLQEYEAQIRKLDIEFAAKCEPIFKQRSDIITGSVDVEFDENDDNEGSNQNDTEDPPVGIPNFWKIVLNNSPVVQDVILDEDLRVLEFLTNVRSSPLTDTPGYQIIFDFEPNPWFVNSSLVKTIYLARDSETGAVVHEKAEATPIIWKPGKNLLINESTVAGVISSSSTSSEQLDDDSEDASDGEEEEEEHSFFTFFLPKDYTNADDDDDLDRIQMDIGISMSLHEEIIPNALLYFNNLAAGSGHHLAEKLQELFSKVNEDPQNPVDPTLFGEKSPSYKSDEDEEDEWKPSAESDGEDVQESRPECQTQ